MDDERSIATPAAHKSEKPLDMFDLRRDIAVHRAGDVMHLQAQMIGNRDGGRQDHLVLDAEQGDDVTRAGLLDRRVQFRQRTNVNHAGPFSRAPVNTRMWPFDAPDLAYRNGS